MPRMNILNTVEREAFESPPVFNSVQRKQYFDFPLRLNLGSAQDQRAFRLLQSQLSSIG